MYPMPEEVAKMPEMRNRRYDELIRSFREELMMKEDLLKVRHMRELISDLYLAEEGLVTSGQVEEYEYIVNQINKIDGLIEDREIY